MNMNSNSNSKADNVGIIAMEIYFPQNYVNQTDLEKYDKVSEGKYTVGLGQTNMAFSGDREDIVSMCLSSVRNLMEKYNIDYKQIGRLEVGTETIIDKSKSVKSSLMSLFQEYGNNNIEGIDTVNACYGGTNALFNSVQWIESSYWDGRYALVVTGDIAVYAKGPARPTGGAGVVSLLIGPNADIVMDRGQRGVYMENAYDFYKPDLSSEYPYVDGKLSIECYLRALDKCYAHYIENYEKKTRTTFNLDQFDHVIFHSPYNRLVQKSFGRLYYNEYIRSPNDARFQEFKTNFSTLGLDKESYSNPKLDSVSLKISKQDYISKVSPTTLLSKELGNSYCGSVYSGLLSLITNTNDSLIGKKILVFSYGSGLASSFFSFTIKGNKSLNDIRIKTDIVNRLSKRIKSTPEQFTKVLETRESNNSMKSFVPIDPIDDLSPGTYYICHIDNQKLIRHYQYKPLYPSSVPTLSQKDLNLNNNIHHGLLSKL